MHFKKIGATLCLLTLSSINTALADGYLGLSYGTTSPDESGFEDDNGFDYAPDGNGGFVRIPEMYPDGTIVEEYQDAYGVANLRVGFDSADQGWGAYVLGENLFDEEYLIDVGNTGGAFGLATIIRGKPQMLKAGVYFKF